MAKGRQALSHDINQPAANVIKQDERGSTGLKVIEVEGVCEQMCVISSFLFFIVNAVLFHCLFFYYITKDFSLILTLFCIYFAFRSAYSIT